MRLTTNSDGKITAVMAATDDACVRVCEIEKNPRIGQICHVLLKFCSLFKKRMNCERQPEYKRIMIFKRTKKRRRISIDIIYFFVSFQFNRTSCNEEKNGLKSSLRRPFVCVILHVFLVSKCETFTFDTQRRKKGRSR